MDEDGWTDDLPWIGQYILDEHGDAVPASGLLSWGRWLADHPKERRLADDTIGNARVSTIFLALDCGSLLLKLGEDFDPSTYRPLLWETMVFGGPYDQYMARYTSKADALAGHGKIVQMLTS
jgi:hypothetical protein